MKVSSIGHAAILVETKGVRILSDPWWQGPCFGVQWWIYPQPCLEPVKEAPLDFIYVSHGHHDHLHGGTLRRLDKSAKVLVSSALDVAPSIRALGFTVVELDPTERHEIAPGVTVEITPTHSGDTLMVVDDGDQVCANLNDALHAAPLEVVQRSLEHLSSRYPTIDYLFCGYGIASHFPNCFAIPDMDRLGTAARRQQHFNRKWATIVAQLEPKIAVPFAADVVFYEHELFWANEPVHNSERPTDALRELRPDLATLAIDGAPGLVLEDGTVINDARFEPVVNDRLAADRSKEIATANRVTKPSDEQVKALAAQVRANVDMALDYLRELDGDYRFLIELRESDRHIVVAKNGSDIAVDTQCEPLDRAACNVVFTTRFSYLRRALSTAYGYEVIFVGSGGLFRYHDRADALRNLHRELTMVLNKLDAPPHSRFGDQPKVLFELKQFVKGLIGREDEDLYDLATWTVWQDTAQVGPSGRRRFWKRINKQDRPNSSGAVLVE